MLSIVSKINKNEIMKTNIVFRERNAKKYDIIQIELLRNERKSLLYS